jgi:TonB family protein
MFCWVSVMLANLPAWLPKPPAKKIPASKLLDRMVRRSTLAEPGGRPFYLKATMRDRDDDKSQLNGTVEEYWISPTKWRRVIKLRDFSQTKVVNGSDVYEDNNGDYFPVEDENLADEIVNPLPRSTVDLLKKLDLVAIEPGTGDGRCPIIDKYFKDAGGQNGRVVLAYYCDTGLLMYFWSPSYSNGVMTDYRKFHGKLLAFATQDNPVNIHVDTLRDLDARDGNLFAVARQTPLDRRVTTKTVNEAEIRKFIAQKTEIRWPGSAGKPNENSVRVDVVIGRDGRVKEAWTYDPVDNATEDAVLTAVRKWTFSPQTVDGIPAQIKSTLTLPFSANVQTASWEESQDHPK